MRRILWPLFIGLICWAAAIAFMRWQSHTVATAQVHASDLFMISPQGPRLGARPATEGIVLLFFDFKTANDRGYVRSYSDDLQLYRQLLDAGAKIVYDARLVAAASPETFAECRPLLDGMLEIDNTGKLLRDIWLTSSIEAEHGATYAQICTQNVIDSHPHALPSVAARIYPLAYFTSSGVFEAAPLRLYRNLRGLPALATSEVGDQLRTSGIMSKWHEFSPNVVPNSDVPKSAYRVDNFSLSWQSFAPSSVLIPPAGFWVSYDPSLTGYERLSYIDVLNGKEKDKLRDKAVLIGFSADVDPGSNTYQVPNSIGKAATIEVMACATQTLLDNRSMQEVPRGYFYLLGLLVVVSMALVTGLAKPLQAVGGGLGLLIVYFVAAAVAYRAGWYADFFMTPVAATIAAIPAAAVNAWLNQRARQRVIDLFGRYVPRAIVNQLIQKSELQTLTLGGTKREVTVMFADIRGFTSFSQDLAPEQVVSELNSLLEVMVKCTFEYEGTLDKFIGDAILVLFNAPLDQTDHTQRAVQTAVAIQRQLRHHQSKLKVGIGIHCGSAVIGNIGTPQRMEFTAIGRTVNIASRLCDLAAPGEIIISGAVMKELNGQANVEQQAAVTVKGITEPLEVAKVLIEEA